MIGSNPAICASFSAGVAMKSRLTLATVVLFAVSFLGTAFAQDPTSGQNKDPKKPDAQTQSQDPSKSGQGDAGQSKAMGAEPDKVKHSGGLSDVDAIGNRDCGGKGLGNWY